MSNISGTAAVSYVDWPAILAGAVVASAIAFILSTFGAALGLSLVSPYEGVGLGSTAAVIAIGLWTVWVAASSFMAGGYLTGRLRHRFHDATEHESDIRDGAHGLVMWGVGVLITALLLAAGATTTARIGMEAAQAVGSAAGSAAGAAASGTEQPDLSYLADLLLRPSGEAGGLVPGEGAAGPDAAPQVARVLQNASSESGLAAEDREYLAGLIARQTGLPPEQAEARIDEALSRYQAMEQELQEAADAARKLSIAAAFVLAASLLIGGAGAWYAAQTGGQHRDEQTVFRLFGRRR